MSYACKSEQTKETTETLVLLHIQRLGWRCFGNLGRDAPYDIVIDRGVGRMQHGLQRFETVQVKYIGKSTKVPVCTRRNAANERVSVGGKTRNNNHYDDHEVTYIAAVTSKGDILFYHFDVYSQFDVEFDTRTTCSTELPQVAPARVPPSRTAADGDDAWWRVPALDSIQ